MLGARLKSARLAAGFSQDQAISHLLEKGMEITKAALSYYENGKRTPGASMVKELGRIYGATTTSFFKEEPSIQINWYSYRASSSKLKKRSRLEIEAFSEEKARRLMEIYGLVPSFNADFPKRRIVKTFEDADSTAQQIRLQWKLGLYAIESITQCLENHGAMLIHYDRAPTSAFDGLSASINNRFPLLIVNSNVPVDRLRFDLAHELGHVLMDTSQICDSKKEEKIVHRFASSFLVPPAVVEKELGVNRRNITLSELLLLKEKYGMSVCAWAYSAFTHGIIAKSLYEQLFKILSAKGWRKNEPQVYKGNETPTRLQQTVLRLVAEGALTPQKVLELFPDLAKTLENEGFMINSKAGRSRKLSLSERTKELEKGADIAAELYKTDKSLTGFHEDDFHDYK